MLTQPDHLDDTVQPWLSLPSDPSQDIGGMALDLQPRHALLGGALRAAEASLRWGTPGTPADHDTRARACAWLLGRACREAQDWNIVQDVPRLTTAGIMRFAPAVLVSVDMSPAFLRDETLAAQTQHALTQSGLAPWLLEIAVPAQAAAEGNTELLQNLSALRNLGVGLALEDFGGLTASPRWLQRLKLTAVKLDPSLIRDLTDDHAARGAVKAAIALAHGLGANVVATGVHTTTQRDILADLGCDDAQGPLFGTTMRPELFLAALLRALA